MPAMTVEDRYNRHAERRRMINVLHVRSPLAVAADERTDDELIAMAQEEHAAALAFEASPAGIYMAAAAEAREHWQTVNGFLAAVTHQRIPTADNRQAILDAIHGAEMEMLKVTDALQRAVAALDEVA